MRNILILLLFVPLFTQAQITFPIIKGTDTIYVGLENIHYIQDAPGRKVNLFEKEGINPIASTQYMSEIIASLGDHLLLFTVGNGDTVAVNKMHIRTVQRTRSGKATVFSKLKKTWETLEDYDDIFAAANRKPYLGDYEDVLSDVSDLLEVSNDLVWYVQKWGDNSNAVLGDPFFPCADPWAAIDSASSGQTVWVGSGLYFIGTDTLNNLWKPGVNMYFEQGARILSYPVSRSPISCIFNINTAGTMNVYGFGTIGSISASPSYTQAVALFGNNVDGATLNIQANYANAVTFQNARNCKVKLHTRESAGTIFLRPNVTADSLFYISADLINEKMVGVFTPAFWTANSRIYNINLNAYIGDINTTSKNTSMNAERGLFVLASGGTGADIQCNIYIKNAKIVHPSGQYVGLYGVNNLISHARLRYNLHCDQCYIDGGTSGVTSEANGLTTSTNRMNNIKGVISGNYIFRNGARMIKDRTDSSNSETDIKFSGKFVAEDGPLVETNSSEYNAVFEGEYICEQDTSPFVITAAPNTEVLRFQNALVIVKPSSSRAHFLTSTGTFQGSIANSAGGAKLYNGTFASTTITGRTDDYGGDYSGDFTTNSKVSKKYVDDNDAVIEDTLADHNTRIGDLEATNVIRDDTLTAHNDRLVALEGATYLSDVSHDGTLAGDGTVGDPLAVDTTNLVATKSDIEAVDSELNDSLAAHEARIATLETGGGSGGGQLNILTASSRGGISLESGAKFVLNELTFNNTLFTPTFNTTDGSFQLYLSPVTGTGTGRFYTGGNGFPRSVVDSIEIRTKFTMAVGDSNLSLGWGVDDSNILPSNAIFFFQQNAFSTGRIRYRSGGSDVVNTSITGTAGSMERKYVFVKSGTDIIFKIDDVIKATISNPTVLDGITGNQSVIFFKGQKYNDGVTDGYIQIKSVRVFLSSY